MLLPSALSCDSIMAQPKPQRPARPKLPSFERYDPSQRSQSPVVGLIASCRALHSMLGERFSSSTPSSQQIPKSAEAARSPFGELPPPFVRSSPPRGMRKRRRDEFEEDEMGDSCDKSNVTNERDVRCNIYSTPKRRRIVPLELPPGLQAADFESLADTNSTLRRSPRQKQGYKHFHIPTCDVENIPPQSENGDPSWTDNDDRLLVETVLSKLRLSPREWNDCAMQLGKDKDSLGRRWRILLGEGNVGLRRGCGMLERPDLDIRSW